MTNIMHSSIQRRAIKLAVLLTIQCNDIAAFTPPSLPSSRTSPSQQLHHPSSSKSSVHPASTASTSRLLQLQLSSSLPSDIDNDEYMNMNIPTITSSSMISSISAASMDKMKELGNSLILQAALTCGATEPMVDIEWKADRIIVTVDVHNDEHYNISDDEEEDDVFLMEVGDYLDGELMEDEIEWDDDDDGEDDDGTVYDDGVEERELGEEGEFEEEEFDPEALGLIPDDDSSTDNNNTTSSTTNSSKKKIDLTQIARSINELLAQDGEDTLSFTIAKLHEIEVTTPDFDNTLRGKVMFENYRGFDVSVEHWKEPKKTKKKKTKKNKKTKAQKEEPVLAVVVVQEASVEEEEPPLPEPPTKLTITEGKLVGRDYDKGVTMVNVKGRVVKIKNDTIECVRLPKAKTEKGVKKRK